MALKFDGLAKEAVLDDGKINNGVWIHLDGAKTDPETGAPLPMCLGGDPAKPQRALVRSQRCTAIKEAEEARRKQGFVKMRVAKRKERDGVIVDSSILPEKERFGCILVALENFSVDAPYQAVSMDDAKAMYGMSEYDHIVQQVKEASFDDDNYLAGAETEVGNASPPPPPAATKTAAKPEVISES